MKRFKFELRVSPRDAHLKPIVMQQIDIYRAQHGIKTQFEALAEMIVSTSLPSMKAENTRKSGSKSKPAA
jgi:hypothetical protein